MKHEMPAPARIPVLICFGVTTAFCFAVVIFLIAKGGFTFRLLGTISMMVPSFTCIWARMLGWKPKRRKAIKPEIALNLGLLTPATPVQEQAHEVLHV